MLGKVVTGKRVTLPAQSPLVSAYVRKKETPFARANSPRECSDCLALTELTWLHKPKTLYGEKLAQLGGWPYTVKSDPATWRQPVRNLQICRRPFSGLSQICSVIQQTNLTQNWSLQVCILSVTDISWKWLLLWLCVAFYLVCSKSVADLSWLLVIMQ